MLYHVPLLPRHTRTPVAVYLVSVAAISAAAALVVVIGFRHPPADEVAYAVVMLLGVFVFGVRVCADAYEARDRRWMAARDVAFRAVFEKVTGVRVTVPEARTLIEAGFLTVNDGGTERRFTYVDEYLDPVSPARATVR